MLSLIIIINLLSGIHRLDFTLQQLHNSCRHLDLVTITLVNFREKLIRRKVMGIWQVRQKIRDSVNQEIGTLDLEDMKPSNHCTNQEIEAVQSSVQVYKLESCSRMRWEQQYIILALVITRRECSEVTQQQDQFLRVKSIGLSILREILQEWDNINGKKWRIE